MTLGASEVTRRELERVRLLRSMPFTGVPAPVPSWRAVCGEQGRHEGLAAGWFITVAGATGHRKTFLALNMAAAAVNAGQHVLYLSAEMTRASVLSRLMLIMLGEHIRDTHDSDRLKDMHDRFLPMVDGRFALNNPQSALSASWVREQMRRWHHIRSTRLVVIDYLQEIQPDDRRGGPSGIREMINSFRSLGRELGQVVVSVSQLNRQTVNEGMVTVTGLQGSSGQEQASDQVVLIDHRHSEHVGAQYMKTGSTRTWLHIAKNRYDRTGAIPVWWQDGNQQLHEAAVEDASEWPKYDRFQRRLISA